MIPPNRREPLATQAGFAVYLAEESEGEAWDGALLSLSGGSPFANFAWRGVLRDHFGVEPLYLFARQESNPTEWEGCLACYVNRDWTGRRHLYGVRQGLFARHPGAAAALIAAVRHLTVANGCVSFDLSSAEPIETDHEHQYTRSTFRLNLDRDHDAMWRQLRDKTRNMVRRAKKNGVSVRELQHDDQAFQILSRHNELNLLPKGVAVPDKAYFAKVCGHHGDRAHIVSAWLDEEPIASMLILRHGNHAAYPVQNADPRYQRLAPIQLLTWQAMCLGAEQGCRWLDMGESREGSPVYKAKRNFGGQPKAVYCLREVTAAGTSAAWARPYLGALSILDAAMMNRAPFTLRRRYGWWRVRSGRIL